MARPARRHHRPLRRGARRAPADIGSRVLLETVRDTAARELAAADSRVYEFSVTTFPLGGPSLVLLIASRTQVNDARERHRLPGQVQRGSRSISTSTRRGCGPPRTTVCCPSPRWSATPSGSSGIICRTRNETRCSPTGRPRAGLGAAAWRDDLERVIRDQVRPAIGRYADLLAELLPRSRPPEQAGLLYVPGGVPAYASCVRNGTTLPFDPDELHRLGLAALAEIEEQIGELGRRALGASDATSTTSWSGSARTPR